MRTINRILTFTVCIMVTTQLIATLLQNSPIKRHPKKRD